MGKDEFEKMLKSKYKCDLCHKAYDRISYLERHMAVHSGIKPFKCEFCESTFTYETNMKAH